MNLDLLETILSTEKLSLEPILPKHAAFLFESLQSTDLYTFIPTNPPKSINALEKKFTKWSSRCSLDQSELWLNYAIYNKGLEKYVGTIQATLEINSNTYIAYEIFPCYWRCGFACEAVSKLIKHLFLNYPNPDIETRIIVQTIGAYSEDKKYRVTSLVIRCFLDLLDVSRDCARNVFSMSGLGNYKNSVITAHLDTRNIASIKLLESLSFKRTAVIENADYFKGKSSDEYVYKLQTAT